MDKKQRIIFYIDGFNFYFGLRQKKWKKYYWLDIVKFCSQFVRPHQDLIEVNYFSAVPTNSSGDADRQDLFFSGNKLNSKFSLHLGKFLEKNKFCPHCQGVIKAFEEKETDVHIATNMIRDVVLDKCDISILISADSDLIPPINFIREYKSSHKIIVYFPPKRISFDLQKKADVSLKLDSHQDKFEKSMLDEEITLSNGFVLKRPNHWV
jgi:uncharacterized LabA/DUF88 family protein